MRPGRPRFLAAVLALAIHGACPSARAFNSVNIPLTVVQINDGGYLENKVGLWAYVGTGTSAQVRFYQLDTGSSGFFAAYAPTDQLNSGVSQWWGDVSDDHVSGVAGYGSNVSLNFDVVTTTVTLSNSAGDALLAIDNVQLGRVQTASNPTNWQTVTEAGQPALHGTFYGNFGADIYPHTTDSSTTNLFTLLGQIPGANGFVVHLGNLANPDPAAPPTLTIGIDDAMRARFAYKTPLVPNADGAVFPTTGYAASEEYNVTASYSFTQSGTTQSFDGVSTLLDTGGPTTTVREPVNASYQDENGNLISGVEFSMTFPGVDGSAPFTISYPAGSTQSVDLVAVDDNGSNNVNAGLNPYAYTDVMFDLEKGVMRFAPIPEPSSLGLAALSALLVMKKIRQKRS